MKKRRKKIVLTKDGKKVAACAAVGAVLLALLLFFAMFKVDNVSVVGSTRYSDEEIRQMAMGSPLDSNTLLAVWFHRHQEAEDIAFVESFDLEMLDSHSIRIHVNEKDIVGYVAKDGQKLYFDKDGNVVETEAQKDSEILNPEEELQELETLRQEAEQQEALKAQQQEAEGEEQEDEDTGEESGTSAQQMQVLEPEVVTAQEDGSSKSQAAVTDVPLILGLDMQNVRLGEKISVKDEGIFNTILGITRMVEKYQILPECVLFDEDNNITLVYHEGNIHCQLGPDSLLEEKITRVAALLPQLENLTGILHLEDYTEETVNIFFSEESLYTLKLTVAEAEGILDDEQNQNTDSGENGDTAGQDSSEEDSSEQDTDHSDAARDSGGDDAAGQTDQSGDSAGQDGGETDSSEQIDGTGQASQDTGADSGTAGKSQQTGSQAGQDSSGISGGSDTGQNAGDAAEESPTGAATGSQGGNSLSSGVRDLVGG